MEDQDLYKRAKKRVENRIGFYIHLCIYLTVNTLLIIINLNTSTQYYWFKWPLLGWGVGLLFHAIEVFASPMILSIKERMIKKEMEKESLNKRT